MSTPNQTSVARLREIFLRAVELTDQAQRQKFLEEACVGDMALRKQIDDLLTSHKDDSFLQHPAIRADHPPDPSCALTVSSSVGQELFGSTALPSYGDAPSKSTIHYFGDYELIEEIARGGMGVVWKARQASLNRTVALKMILAGKFASEADVKRFRLEAEAAANLQHPNIVAIHEVGEHEGRHYFSMDYVEGKNLTELLRDQQLPPAKSAQYVKTIAEAIQYAHQRGILHRDLKPQNVLIDERDQPRVTDFGLAKLATADGGLTQTGAVMGSPSYMPPEQAAGRYDQVGPHSDVYSLGAVLYELLTSQPPHGGETPVETLRHVLEREATPPHRLNPLVNSDLETICLKCLEKDPRRRYATARELADDLGRFLTHEPILARRANPVRRLWSWFIRHPWIVTGASSLVVMITMGFGYRMWERVNALEWKQAHPKDPVPYGTAYFFPAWLGVGLFFEFFFLQLVPVMMFLILRGRTTRGGHFFGAFAAVGAAQVLFGVEVLRRAVAAQAWDSAFSDGAFFASIAALTNVWFGSILTSSAIRESRLDLPGIPSREEPIEQPLGFTNRELILRTLSLEVFTGFLFLVGAMASSDNSFERMGGCALGPLGMWGMTGIILIGHLIGRSKGLEHQSHVAFFILSVGLAFVGSFGLGTATWYVVPQFYLLGISVGLFLLKRAPLQRGHWLIAPPKQHVERVAERANQLRFSKPWIIAAVLILEFLSLFCLLEAKQQLFLDSADQWEAAVASWLGFLGTTLLLLTTSYCRHVRGLNLFLCCLLLPLPTILWFWVDLMLIATARVDLTLIAVFHLGGILIGKLLLRHCPLQRGGVPVKDADAWLSFMRLGEELSRKRLAHLAWKFAALIVLFYLIEDWRGIHAWKKAKGRLEAEGAVVEWSEFAPKKGVPDAENVFKHPFMEKYAIRRASSTPIQNPNWWDHGFVGYGPDAATPIPMANLKKLPLQPEARISVASQERKRTSSQAVATFAFTNSPLTEVVRFLARQADLDVRMEFDREPFVRPKASQWDAAIGQWLYTNEPTIVSFNVTDSTPEDALDILLQNHHLNPVYDAVSGVCHIQQARVSLSELMDRLTKNDPELRQMDEALQRPQAQLDWTDDTPLWDIPFPNYVLVLRAAQGLATRGKIHLLRNNPDAALRDVMLMGRITESFTAHTTLVGGMLKVALGGLLTEVLEEGLTEELWPATHLVAMPLRNRKRGMV